MILVDQAEIVGTKQEPGHEGFTESRFARRLYFKRHTRRWYPFQREFLMLTKRKE
jgi:hypothetical protein